MEHVLALRGDYPRGWTGTGGEFDHATDLIAYIRKEFGDRFEIAVAAAPGGHVDCVSEDVDISYLKMKQDLGADYIITQLCYDLEQFKVWRDKVDKAGITMPIDVGIMPVTTKHGILTQCFSHNACAVPRDLALVLTHHWFQKDPDGNRTDLLRGSPEQISSARHQWDSSVCAEPRGRCQGSTDPERVWRSFYGFAQIIPWSRI